MFTRLNALGTAGEQIKIADIATEELRRLLHLVRTHPCRHQIGQHLYTFYTWCAEGDIAELLQLARTVEAWWPQIEAFLHTAITNADSEATNRVSKLEGRNAYGFRNPDHQRLRYMVASTRHRRYIHRMTSKTGQAR